MWSQFLQNIAKRVTAKEGAEDVESGSSSWAKMNLAMVDIRTPRCDGHEGEDDIDALAQQDFGVHRVRLQGLLLLLVELQLLRCGSGRTPGLPVGEEESGDQTLLGATWEHEPGCAQGRPAQDAAAGQLHTHADQEVLGPPRSGSCWGSFTPAADQDLQRALLQTAAGAASHRQLTRTCSSRRSGQLLLGQLHTER